jgi:F0F1-type ATP synthase assembly protein I
MNPKLEKPKKKFDDFIRYSNLAFEMFAIIGAGTWLGWFIDNWLELKFPVFILICMTCAVIGAIFYAIRKFL